MGPRSYNSTKITIKIYNKRTINFSADLRELHTLDTTWEYKVKDYVFLSVTEAYSDQRKNPSAQKQESNLWPRGSSSINLDSSWFMTKFMRQTSCILHNLRIPGREWDGVLRYQESRPISEAWRGRRALSPFLSFLSSAEFRAPTPHPLPSTPPSWSCQVTFYSSPLNII